MYELLKEGTYFEWTEKCEKAFNRARQEITSNRVLVHFDREKPINLYCDASQLGIAAVLTHVFPNGTDKPIAFASSVLQPAEKNYAVIQKKALAIYFRAKKFFQYLIGNKFNLFSDHKPLEALFGENKSLPEMAAGRLQRWAVFLSGFEYTFKHIKGKSNCLADGLSRLPIEIGIVYGFDDGCEYFNFIESSVPLTAIQLKVEIRKDPELSTVYLYTEKGWPNKVDDHLKPYEIRKSELHIDQGVLMWGYRILITAKFRNKLLKELHSTHAGMGKMKSMARAYFWWPLLDKEIEAIVSKCHACQLERSDPQKAMLKAFEESKGLFERIHIDFLGPVCNKMFLIITDAFTKWPKVFVMNNITTQMTISKLRETFARFGLPKKIVLDNGPQFKTLEFQEFCRNNEIEHVMGATYHPSTNGAAENAVKSFKLGLREALNNKKIKNVVLSTIISRYLLNYRTSARGTTGETPAKLMFGRAIRTRFDLLRPGVKERAIERMKKNHKNMSGDWRSILSM